MEHLGKALQQFLKSRGLEEGIRRERLLRAWPEIVGEGYAGTSRAVRIRNGTLWVEAEGSVRVAELMMLREEILRRYRDRFGEIPFTNIRVRVGYFPPQGGGKPPAGG